MHHTLKTRFLCFQRNVKMHKSDVTAAQMCASLSINPQEPKCTDEIDVLEYLLGLYTRINLILPDWK